MKRFRLGEISLEAELAREGETLEAIREGRVFIERTRLGSTADPVVATGALVTLWPKEEPAQVVILREEEDWVAVDKPAGVPTIADHAGIGHSLVDATKRAIHAPKDLHPTSRLDRGVSGVVVFAKSDRGKSMLARARETGSYARHYVGIGSGTAEVAEMGSFTEAIGRGPKPRERKINGRDATSAETRYRVVSRVTPPGKNAQLRATLFAFFPITGRTHQIRLHASHHGAPLYGDGLYGGPKSLTDARGRVVALTRIALHAASVHIASERESIELVSPLPRTFAELWDWAGGASDDLVAAVQEMLR